MRAVSVNEFDALIDDLFASDKYYVPRSAGGPGSGNHGHAGRPGVVGGSASRQFVSVGGRNVEVVKPKRAHTEQLVMVDVAKWDEDWKKSTSYYVGPDGTGAAIGTRYKQFGEFFAQNDSIEAPEVAVHPDGRVDFTNGRHRMAWLRDQGVTQIPVAMERDSIALAEKFGYIKGMRAADAFKLEDFFIIDPPHTLLKYAKETLVHEAADANVAKVKSAVQYAFALGKRSINHDRLKKASDPLGVIAAMRPGVDAMQAALKRVLPPVLEATVKAGGIAGASMLRKGLRTAGGPGSGNFGHSGGAGGAGNPGGSSSGRSVIGHLSPRMIKNAEAWQKKTGNTRQAMADRVHVMYQRATAEQKFHGRTWYPQARAEAERMAEEYGITTGQAAGVIASLSPLREWNANLGDAENVIRSVVKGEASPEVEKLFRANVGKATDILNGADPEDVLWRGEAGFKVRSFYKNIVDPTAPEVTIDTHMLRILLGDNSVSSKEHGLYAANAGRYAAFRQAVLDVADRTGALPAAVQATVWGVQKAENPVKSVGKHFKAAEMSKDLLLTILLDAVGVLFHEERVKTLGGPGSGNFGHAGRPGQIGGSVTKRGWHLTADRNFKSNPDFKPQMNSIAGDLMDNSPAGLFIGRPEYWIQAHGYERPYVAEVEGIVTNPSGSVMHRGQEEFMQGDIKTIRVLPVDEYIRETYKDTGWIEDYFGDAPKKIDKDYIGRDVSQMSEAELLQWEQRFEEYSNRKEGPKMRGLGGPGSGNFGHAGRPGQVGGSGKGTGFSGLVRDISKPDGGFSYSPLTRTSPTDGYMVSIHKGRELVLDAKDVTGVQLATYVRKNADLLLAPGSTDFLGAWHNPEDGKVYLDVSRHTSSQEEAESLGKQHDQEAYFDLVNGRSVPLKTKEAAYGRAAEAHVEFDQAHVGGADRVDEGANEEGTDAAGDRGDGSDPEGRSLALRPRLKLKVKLRPRIPIKEIASEEQKVKAQSLVKLKFDVTHQSVFEWVSKHAGDLIEDITETTRDRITTAIYNAFDGGRLPEAISEIANVMGDEARAEMIARTETMRAANEGQRQVWQQAVDADLLSPKIRREWIATADDNVCPICDELNGAFTTLDGEYPDPGGDGPPQHPNCRCTEGIVG